MAKLCLCGCGEETKYNKQKKCYNDYINGHNGRGKCPPCAFKKGNEYAFKKGNTLGFKKGKDNPGYGEIPVSAFKKGHTLGFKKGNEYAFKKGNRPPYNISRGKHSICDAGYKVRSSYERKFSDGLYACKIEHIYEPERFQIKGGLSYLPDYLISELNLYIELKGYMDTKSKIRHELFRRQGHKLLVLGKRFFQSDELYKRVLQKLLRKVV